VGQSLNPYSSSYTPEGFPFAFKFLLESNPTIGYPKSGHQIRNCPESADDIRFLDCPIPTGELCLPCGFSLFILRCASGAHFPNFSLAADENFV
jgi:hypothetical protein